MEFEALVGVAGVAIVIGLVEVLKRSIGVADRYTPLASLLCGLLLVVGYKLQYGVEAAAWFETVVQGVILGLSASGLYSGSTTLLNGGVLLRKDAAKGKLVVLLPHPGGPEAPPALATAQIQQQTPSTIEADLNTEETSPPLA